MCKKYIELIDVCNFYCKYVIIGQILLNLSLMILKLILQSERSKNVQQLFLNGRELLLH